MAQTKEYSQQGNTSKTNLYINKYIKSKHYKDSMNVQNVCVWLTN